MKVKEPIVVKFVTMNLTTFMNYSFGTLSYL